MCCPDLLSIVYIDIASVTPTQLAQLIAEKLGPIHRNDYLPPNPIKLFEIIEAESEDERDAITHISSSFMQSLRRMSEAERDLLAEIMGTGCAEELPDNVHVSLDLVRRDIGMAPAEVLETLRGLSSVGIRITTAEVQLHDEPDIEGEDSEHDAADLLAVRWDDTSNYEDDYLMDYAAERSTEVAWAMMTLGSSYCLDHGRDAIKRLDFSALAADPD